MATASTPAKVLSRAQQYLADVRRNRIVLDRVAALHVQMFRRCPTTPTLKWFVRQQIPTLRFHNPQVQISNQFEQQHAGVSHVRVQLKDGQDIHLRLPKGIVDHDVLQEILRLNQGAEPARFQVISPEELAKIEGTMRAEDEEKRRLAEEKRLMEESMSMQ